MKIDILTNIRASLRNIRARRSVIVFRLEEVLMKKTVAVTTFSLTLILACLSVAAQSQSRDDVFKEIEAKIKDIEAKRAELAVLQKKVLAVSDTDRKEFAAFLNQPQTGMIRLLPRETYDGNADRALAIRGGGPIIRSFVRPMNMGMAQTFHWNRGSYQWGLPVRITECF